MFTRILSSFPHWKWCKFYFIHFQSFLHYCLQNKKNLYTKIFIQKSLYKNKLILSYLYFVTPPLEDKSMWKRLPNHNLILKIIISTQSKEHLSLNVNDLKYQSYTLFRCQPFHKTNSYWAMLTILNLNYILTWMPNLYYTLQALFFFFCINPLHPQHQYAYSPYCSPYIS